MNSTYLLPNRRRLLAGAAATAATVAAPAILRAQGGPLKVGVILPRSGYEAGIGQDCQRGVDIAPGVLKALGMPELTIINGDTESNVDTAREHADPDLALLRRFERQRRGALRGAVEVGRVAEGDDGHVLRRLRWADRENDRATLGGKGCSLISATSWASG